MFSPSFSFLWAVFVLFFEGLLDGTTGVAKTYLYEGPILGGFLACPATKFQTFDKPFFKQFPYLLPCVVVACLQFCILIGQEETTCSLLRDRLVLIPCSLYALFAMASVCSTQTLLPLLLVSDSQHGGYNFDAAEISIVLTTLAIYGTITKATLNPYIASKFTYKTVYVSGVVLYAVGIILLPSMVNITLTGAITSRKVANQTANSSDLPPNFTAAAEHFSTSPLVTESYIQPTTEMNTRPVTGQCRLAGDRRKTSQHLASELPARVWGPLLFVTVLIEQGGSQSFLAAIVMVGNAGVQSNRGTVNGIAQTLAALSRLVGPAVSANLFAWTTDNGLPWPLDHHLSFYLVAVLCLLLAVLCASLPASSNLPRAVQDTDSSTVSEEGDGREIEEEKISTASQVVKYGTETIANGHSINRQMAEKWAFVSSSLSVEEDV
ncbi:hypothetical protein Bbelb_027370 [Branchiostoma belcheri]|nr:hypothetical protein Bbelb_027370 [Branchiostoma belcheri]